MSEVKDPKIKLFGRTIELTETSVAAAAAEAAQSCDAAGEDSLIQDPPCSSNSTLGESNLNGDEEDLEPNKGQSGQNDAKKEHHSQPLTPEEPKDTPQVLDDPKELSADSDAGAVQNSKPEEDQNETSNSQEKALKKPDKIIPCPRCNSMDTKFCYFNNYNVNQPRHFCKNCQRYWTAGGTMRNVPVGAGRRKNKTAASQFRHLPETPPNGIHHPVLNPNSTVITFASDTPLCESMVSVLNIADKTVRNCSRNGVCGPEEQCTGTLENATASKDEMGRTGLPDLIPNCNPFPQQVPCFPGAPWPYPYSVPWSAPTFTPPTFPLPFYSTAPPYWGCAVPGAWNLPWVIPPTPTISHNHASANSGPNSPTLGKHSRDDNTLKPVNPEEETEKEKSLWVPKTLRIDDPGEAAKSSIWATLGIKNDRVESVGSGGDLFKAFQAKGDEKTQVQEASSVLQANPAALSRSLSFHESL